LMYDAPAAACTGAEAKEAVSTLREKIPIHTESCTGLLQMQLSRRTH